MINKIFKKFVQKRIITLPIMALMCFFLPYISYAATLSFSPSTPSVSVGNTVALKIYVNSSDKSVNNTEATVGFPVDLLEVSSVTKTSSVFSLWAEEPSFSNSTGKITFSGGVPNPGFIGSSGYVLTINFKTKKQGTANVTFLSAAVRANDGLGTDVLTSKGSSTVTITTPIKVVTPVVKPVEKKVTPVVTPVEKVIAPVIFAPTVRVYANQNILKLNASNVIQNIDYYSLLVDDAQSFVVKHSELINDEYVLPVLSEGSHKLVVAVYDNLKNKTEATLSFVSPAISKPTISLSSYDINVGDFVVVSGKSDYINKQVNIIFELDGKEIKKYTENILANGTFSVRADKIEEVGLINIWAENVVSENIKSEHSEKVYLKVSEIQAEKSNLLKIFYLVLGVTLIVSLLVILFFVIYLSWRKFSSLRGNNSQVVVVDNVEARKTMMLLKAELSSQVALFEKTKTTRILTQEEELVYGGVKNSLKEIDSFLEKK